MRKSIETERKIKTRVEIDIEEQMRKSIETERQATPLVTGSGGPAQSLS